MSGSPRRLLHPLSALLFCALIVLSGIALAVPAFAHDYSLGTLRIGHPWSRATPGGAKIGGGFLTITNTGKDADRFLGGSAEIARVVEIHVMTMDGAVMKMRALEKGLEIKPGESVEFKPGGYHIMLIDLGQPLKEGEMIKATLIFEKAGRLDVEFKVEGRGSSGGTGHGQNSSQGHDAHHTGEKKAP